MLGPRCGDHIVQADQGEQCDDGNTISGDGCSSRCQNENPG
jgi:cysteine-rich repeat protein